MQAPNSIPTIGSTSCFVWWPNAQRAYYLLVALIAGLAFVLMWAGARHLPGQAGDVTVHVDDRFGWIIGVLVAFLIATGNWVLRQAAKDWSRVSVPGFDRSALTAATFAPGRRPSLLCSLVGMLMGCFQLWVTGDLALLSRGYPLSLLATMALVIVFWVLVVQVGGTFLILIRGFYRLGLEVEPDLLRMERLAPFSYIGLRILAVNTTSMAILVLMVGVSDVDLAGLSVPMGFTTLVSVPCFLLPQIGVRRSIRRRRRLMLAQLDARLDQIGFPSPAALESEDSARRVANLASLREQIAQASDWPVSGIGWLRFGMLLLLPAASWAASWVADKLIQSFLA
jgi:hypothetical protein